MGVKKCKGIVWTKEWVRNLRQWDWTGVWVRLVWDISVEVVWRDEECLGMEDDIGEG